MARQVSRQRITEERAAGGAQAHQHGRRPTTASPTAISSSRRRPRRKTSSARSSPSSARRSSRDAIVATNTSSISITRLAAVDRPAGAVHRHPFHESGAADGAGRADPRHRHRRRDLRGRQGVRHQARQDDRGVRGFPGLHRQPHPAADDQRGDLHALRRRRHRRGDRHRDAARRAPSDGPAGARRLHRPRHLPVGHAGAARGAGGFEVPAVPAAGEIRRGRLARPQDRSAASTTIAARSRCRPDSGYFTSSTNRPITEM